MIIIDPDNDKYLDTMFHINDSYIFPDHVITLMAALCRNFPIIDTFRHSKEKRFMQHVMVVIYII